MGYYNPLPLRITLSSVFQYWGIHIQFIRPKFLKFCRSVPCTIFTLNFQDQASRPHKLLLLFLSFQLISKSRNFVAATLFMFPRWVAPTVMMSSAIPTFHWLLHLYLLNFLWIFMLGTFLNGALGRMSHHWSTFLSFTDCSQRDFYILCKPIESCKI